MKDQIEKMATSQLAALNFTGVAAVAKTGAQIKLKRAQSQLQALQRKYKAHNHTQAYKDLEAIYRNQMAHWSRIVTGLTPKQYPNPIHNIEVNYTQVNQPIKHSI